MESGMGDIFALRAGYPDLQHFGQCSELVGAPSPTPLPGEGGRGGEGIGLKMFGKCSELVGAPSPPLSRGKRGEGGENVRKRFGKCSELVGAPSPHPSPGGTEGGKCSENVRNWWAPPPWAG